MPAIIAQVAFAERSQNDVPPRRHPWEGHDGDGCRAERDAERHHENRDWKDAADAARNAIHGHNHACVVVPVRCWRCCNHSTG